MLSFTHLSIFWGSYSSEHRILFDKGYKVALFLTIEIEASADYGDFQVYIPLSANLGHNYVTIRDVQVASRFQNGIAILLCGVFVGIYSLILAKHPFHFLKQRVHRRS